MADKPVLQVKMFGRFQVTCGEHVIVSPDSRNSKVIQLLQYLLCNRGKMILQEELIEVLLHDDYGSNPVSTLKNIVYRLRKLFIGADLDKSCILYKKNRYGFSPDIPCEIDAELFFELTKRVKHAHLDDDSRFALCMQAIELYRSDFLTRSSNEPWVMGRAVRYQEQFCELIRTAYGIAERCGRFDEVLPVLQRATVLYPYEEELYLMHISCLYELRRGREAIEEYNSVANTLYNDLGVSPSQTMQNLYRRITSSMQPVTDSILEVRATISEPEYFTGAYYCNFENFVNIYQFIVRHMERSGQSVYLMLCTLTESDNSPPKNGERLSKLSTALHQAARMSCRRGDVYTRYSPSQFLLMLMNINQENCHIVADRLRYNFFKHSKITNVRLSCKEISAANMDSVMKAHGSDQPPSW